MLKKEQTLLYYIKSEFKNRILFIHVNQIAVPENHDKIITSLRIAHAREYLVDKEQISYDEVLVDSVFITIQHVDDHFTLIIEIVTISISKIDAYV